MDVYHGHSGVLQVCEFRAATRSQALHVCTCVLVCSEREVQAALDKLMVQGKAEAAARTTVMIAHRLSTVAHVDRIFVLQKGSVVEMGSPAELEAMRECFAIHRWPRRTMSWMFDFLCGDGCPHS